MKMPQKGEICKKIAKKYAVLQSSIHLLRPKDKRSQKK